MRKCKCYMLFSLVLVILLGACDTNDNDKSKDTAPPTITAITVPTLAPGELNRTVHPAPPVPITNNDPRLPLVVPTGTEFEQGEALYIKHCSACHGVDGQGQLPDPYMPGNAPPHNNEGHTWHHPDQANFATVWNGTEILGGKMPSFYDTLTADEILQVLAYIKHWWNDEALAVQAERTQQISQAN